MTARRKPQSNRQRRYRARQRDCVMVVSVELGLEAQAAMIDAGWARVESSEDRVAMGKAATEMIAFMARTRQK